MGKLVRKLQNPRQIAQQFRSKSHSDSGVNRTPIPEQIAHFLVGREITG